MVKKPGEGKTASTGRLCYDYIKLNAHIRMKNFPLANTKNFFNESSKYSLFSVIYIQNAFLSIPLTQRAKEYCAIITPFGTYLPTRTPFGLKTSPSSFCFALNKVIGDLVFAHYYMDDILVGASNNEEMVKNLKIIFERLHSYNLKIRISKTKFFRKR